MNNYFIGNINDIAIIIVYLQMKRRGIVRHNSEQNIYI